jgi:hypothetical protein
LKPGFHNLKNQSDEVKNAISFAGAVGNRLFWKGKMRSLILFSQYTQAEISCWSQQVNWNGTHLSCSANKTSVLEAFQAE